MLTLNLDNQKYTILHSQLDPSINFIRKSYKDDGLIETRYVRRSYENFIIYLSSQTGCNQACRFCHLTSTGQTYASQVSFTDYIEQALFALQYVAECGYISQQTKRLKFNWMARGEPLLNPTIINNWPALHSLFMEFAENYGLEPVFNISTIMPKENTATLDSIFCGTPVRISYSLYSTNVDFRKRWLPKANDAITSLKELADFRRNHSNSEVVLHWALIAGENDNIIQVEKTCDDIINCGLQGVRINIIRYNPPNEKSTEGNMRIANYIFGRIPNPASKVVERVGLDVDASCGMFMNN